MFRIRKVSDDIYPMNKHAVKQVMEILGQRFSDVSKEKIGIIPEQLRDPLKYQFKSILLVADNINGRMSGFALLLHAPDLDFCYLDYIATQKNIITTGVGGALYERCREEAKMLKACGIFMECLPDDKELCNDENTLKQNANRLKFYERYGAKPIINTLYETPVKPDDTCPPYLVLDNLDNDKMPSLLLTKKIVEAILKRKYSDYCPIEYIDKVVNSFKDTPIELRENKYIGLKKQNNHLLANGLSEKNHKSKNYKRVFLSINEGHSIHHIKEVGYVEAPVRISSILKVIDKSDFFEKIKKVKFSEKFIRQVHKNDMVNFLKKAEENFPNGNSIYPYIFPIRNIEKRPRDVSVLSGYYCIDTFTPIHRNVWKAATGAVDCAMSCANKLIQHNGLAYALVRPPGHHAESKVFGGFCYFNTAAVVANYLSQFGKVAILDIDYHHGNGQQEIFYGRKDVLTISIHGHPSKTYPYFCGFKEERGEGEGIGYNFNYPIKEGTTADDYKTVLSESLKRVEAFNPAYLIICFGLDTAKGDPTGTLSFGIKDFERNGRMIGSLKIPTLVVQEGGYFNKTLGSNVLHFFSGLRQGYYM
jgi:acetoin utilization deacetylase AcuC-like enzyme